MDDNKHILRQFVLAVEFLAKQALPFRGHHEDKVDFSVEDMDRGNFIAMLQIVAKGIVFYESTSLLKAMQNTQVKPFKIRLFISMHAKSEKRLLSNYERIAYLSSSWQMKPQIFIPTRTSYLCA